MMKKNIRILTIVLLTLCLAGFVFDQIMPARTVFAASENHPKLNSANPSEKEAVPLTPSMQPVVYIVTGLVCVLFVTLAAFPLLVEDPDQVLREANRDEV